MIRPRLRSLPPALGTRGGELVELAELLGYELDDWQQLAANDVLAVDGDGRLAAFEAVLLASRQCGKSLVGELYALLFALAGERVLHTSHRADSAKEIFRRLLASLPDELGAEPTFTNGKEQIVFPSGGVILFRTRGPRVGRGYTLHKLVVDECQITGRDELDAALPTLRTRDGAQVLYLGCAPNANQNDKCDVLFELRERAKAGSDALCFLEWSAAAVDDEGNELPGDQLPEAILDDETFWTQATPALGKRITLDRMRVEREALDPVSFAVEYLSVGVWPDARGAGGGPVSLEAWEELIDPDSELDPDEEIAEVVVGFDMNARREVSVCLVGLRADVLMHLDYVGRFLGADAAVRAIAGLVERDDIDVRAVVCDGEPQNMDLLRRLGREYVPERVLRAENASKAGVASCGALIDIVNQGKLRHRGQREIADAIRGAVVKTFSDSWVYSRSRSKGDVSPLLAAACALWVADAELELAGVGPHIW